MTMNLEIGTSASLENTEFRYPFEDLNQRRKQVGILVAFSNVDPDFDEGVWHWRLPDGQSYLVPGRFLQPAPVASTQYALTPDSTLTPQQLDAMREMNQPGDTEWDNSWHAAYYSPLEKAGYVEYHATNERFELTQAGREHLSTLASEPADDGDYQDTGGNGWIALAEDAAHKPFTDDDMKMWTARLATNYIGYMVQDDECCPGAVKHIMADIESLVNEVERLRTERAVKISMSDAYQAHTALVALVNRLNEHMDNPDYEGDTDNLVRLIRETEAVLDRFTAQLR